MALLKHSLAIALSVTSLSILSHEQAMEKGWCAAGTISILGNFSLNKPLLEKFKLRKPNTRWTIYRIDPNVIFQDYCYFYYTNAAFSGFKNVPEKHLSSPNALLDMFDSHRKIF